MAGWTNGTSTHNAITPPATQDKLGGTSITSSHPYRVCLGNAKVQPTRPTNSSLSNPSFLLTYTLSSRRISLHRPSHPPAYLQLGDETFWDLFSALQSTLTARLGKAGRSTHGWRGGWVGWFGYEMKEESLAGFRRKPVRGTSVGKEGADGEGVDAAWGWCDCVLERGRDGEWVARGIVSESARSEVERNGSPSPDAVDGSRQKDLLEWLESQGVTFGVSPSDFDAWCDDLDLSPFTTDASRYIQPAESFPPFCPSATGDDYTRRIQQCREAIRQGESYELTLTTSFTSTLPPPPPPSSPLSSTNTNATSRAAKALSLYLRQRTHNPAYYSTFLSFPSIPTDKGQGVTVLSSSPERFLRIDEGVVEMMPIKGTRARVKKGECVCAPGRGCEGRSRGNEECRREGEVVDRERGEALSRDPKERAENLMVSTDTAPRSWQMHINRPCGPAELYQTCGDDAGAHALSYCIE